MPTCPTCKRPLPDTPADADQARLDRRIAAHIRYWLDGIDEATPKGAAFARRCARDGLGWKSARAYCGAGAALVDREVNGLDGQWAFEFGSSCYRRVAEVVEERGDAYKARPGREARPGETVVVGYAPGTVLGVDAAGRDIEAMWWGGHITTCVARVDDDTGPGGRSGLYCIGMNQRGQFAGGTNGEGVTLTFYPFERKRAKEMAVMWVPTILPSDFTGTPGPTPTAEELAELLYLVKAA